MVNVVNIYITQFKEELPKDVIKDYLSLLPYDLQERNSRFLRWQDRYSNLFGKLLLLEGLKDFGFDQSALSELKYTNYNRPYLNEKIDFNISHSGEFVICAIGKDLRLGVDIEEIKEVEFSDFKQVMTSVQWDTIFKSTKPMHSFFNLWAIKESMIKADSRGLSIPLLDLHLKSNHTINYDNKTWYLQELKIDPSYCSYLSSNKPEVKISIIEIDFSECLNPDIKKWKAEIDNMPLESKLN